MQLKVVYSSDAKFLCQLKVSAASLLKYNPKVHVIVLGLGLDERNVEDLKTFIECRGGTFSFIAADRRIDSIKAKTDNGYTSYATYARAFIAELLSAEHGKVLYLDADTLVRGSLDELFSTPLNGKVCAMSADYVTSGFKRYQKLAMISLYHNAGVMLIDLEAWRKNDCTRRFLREIEHPSGPIVFPDQDIINRVFQAEIAPLSLKWNVLTPFLMFSYRGMGEICGEAFLQAIRESDYVEAVASPRILHFAGNTLARPWLSGSRHPYRKEYRALAEELGLWPQLREKRGMEKKYLLQYFLWKLLPQRLFDFFGRVLYRLNVKLGYSIYG